MLEQLNTVFLIKEAIKLSFFRLVEYLEHQHLWARLQARNGQKQEKLRLFHARNCQGSRTALCTTPFTEERKLFLTRIERGVGGPGAQLSKRTSTLECLV